MRKLVTVTLGAAVAFSPISLATAPASAAVVHVAAADKLMPGQWLKAGQTRRSANGAYLLAMQSDGNLVMYDRAKKAIWSSGTGKQPGASAVMQKDGNLVVYSTAKRPLWSSGTGDTPGAFLAVQGDGNLVIYAQSGEAVWERKASFARLTADRELRPGDYLRSAQRRYRLVMQEDGNLVLQSGGAALWSSKTGGNAGAFAVMQNDGNFVVYSSGDKPLWGTRTAGNPGAFLQVQDDGNMVIYTAGGDPLWSSR
ncbi:hypothetical protein [Spongiactinospora sp. 9N601]|uniref:hypothetical protein n=1 Tax=Spongiactinospora sp. 9N601 TaxID=3375149 RepID=UPI0037BDC448